MSETNPEIAPLSGRYSADGSQHVTGEGTQSDPLTFDAMRPADNDPVAAGIAKQGACVDRFAAAFRSTADLSANLPADVRQLVQAASSAITGTVAKANDARRRADDFMNDVRLYPEGRRALAAEAIKAAQDAISDAFEDADAKLIVAEAELFMAARPKLPSADALTARADLDMVTRQAIASNSTTALANTLKQIAQGDDSLAALVADQTYLKRFLTANGVARDVTDAVVTGVKAAIMASAASSGDPKRAAAGRTAQALVKLRQSRAAAMSYTRNTLAGKGR
jgi:hypothetical protein